MTKSQGIRAPFGAKNDERFDFYVEPEPMSGCHLWTGNSTKWGHGYFSFRKEDGLFRNVIAHRYAYSRAVGAIPENKIICHKCNNAACVNPDHLYAGTPKQNTHDAMRAGTHRSVRRDLLDSERNGRAKLTWATVAEMRQEFAAGGKTKTELAKKYGVSLTAAKLAINGETWSATS